MTFKDSYFGTQSSVCALGKKQVEDIAHAVHLTIGQLDISSKGYQM